MEKAANRILTEIDKLRKSVNPLIIAIDGRCASGKTTFTAMLQNRVNCNVFHMDDFFLRPEQRIETRFSQPGGNVDYERFREEVLVYASAPVSFYYRPYDCHKRQLTEPVFAPSSSISIVEGSYSCHPSLWDYYSLRIFLTVDKQEQMSRIRARNGETQAKKFEQTWIPLEEQYFSAYQIKKRCDICLETDNWIF